MSVGSIAKLSCLASRALRLSAGRDLSLRSAAVAMVVAMAEASCDASTGFEPAPIIQAESGKLGELATGSGQRRAAKANEEVAKAVRWLLSLESRQPVVGRFGWSFVPKLKAKLKANLRAGLKA